MQQNNLTSVRELLEQMPTEQLDEMLRAELDTERPDENAVRIIMGILREREQNISVVLTPGIQVAWERYRRDSERIERTYSRKKQVSAWALRAASLLVLIGLLIAVVPQSVQAESFWERLVRWTDSIFEFFSPDTESSGTEEYVFETDNPGLQQVYDAVVEMGVTEPVVPMWLPEGYELVEIIASSVDAQKFVYARFSDGSNEIVFKTKLYNFNVPNKYHKDDSQVGTQEKHGTTFNVLQNNEAWVVIWAKDNIECFLTVDCQEEMLDKILESIYVMEDN